MLRSGLLAAGVLIVVACVLPDLDYEGKACPCVAGYVCDVAANRCVASLLGGGGSGAGDGSGGGGAQGATGAGTSTGGSGGDGGASSCGDAVIDEGETCDPPSDTCGDDCQLLEICDDGADNDGDELEDCDDPDCERSCPGPLCDDAAPLQDRQSGTTEGASALFQGSCVGWDTNAERLYTFTASERGALVLEVSGATDHGIHVRQDCLDSRSEYGCVDDAGDDSTDYLAVPMEEGETVTVIVDTFEPIDIGPYDLVSYYESLDEDPPNGTAATAEPADDGFDASIYPIGDQDWFTITVPGPSSTLGIEIVPFVGECHFDSEIELYQPDGATAIDYDDDGAGNGGCSALSASGLPAGTYYLRVASPQSVLGASTFVYEIDIEIL